MSSENYDEEFEAELRRRGAGNYSTVELKEMLETANTQHVATMEKLKRESEKAERLEQQNAKLRGDLDSLSNQLAKSEQQRESQFEEMAAELDRLAGSVAVKEGKLEEANKTVDELEKGKSEVLASHQDAVNKLHDRNQEIEKLTADFTLLQQQNAQMQGQMKEQDTAAEVVKAELQVTKEKLETLSQQLEADSSSGLDPTVVVPKTRAPLVKRVPGNEIYVRYNGHVWCVNPSAEPPKEGLVQRVTQPDIQPDVEMTELDDILLCERKTSWTHDQFIIVMGTKQFSEWSLLCGVACYDAEREQFFASTFRVLDKWYSSHAYDYKLNDKSPGHLSYVLLSSAKFNLLDQSIRSQLTCRMSGVLRYDMRLEYDSVQEVALVRLPTGQHNAIVVNFIQKPGTQSSLLKQKLRFNSGISGTDWRPHAAPAKEEITTNLLENEQVVLTVRDRSAMITTKLLFLWRRNNQPESAGYMTLAYKVDGAANSDGNGDASSNWRHTPVYAHYRKSRGRTGHEDTTKEAAFLWYTENEGRRSHRKLPVSKALIQYCGRFAERAALPGANGNN